MLGRRRTREYLMAVSTGICRRVFFVRDLSAGLGAVSIVRSVIAMVLLF